MSDDGRLFAYGQGRVPDCLLFGGEDVSPWEARLYGVLDRYGQQFGATMPNRRTLARHLGCSLATLDRAKQALVERRLLLVRPRYAAGRGQVANDYHLLPGPLPGGAAGPLPDGPGAGAARPHVPTNGAAPAPPSSPEPPPLLTGDEAPLLTGDEPERGGLSPAFTKPPPAPPAPRTAWSGDLTDGGGGEARSAPKPPQAPPPDAAGRGPIPPERLAAIAEDIAAAIDPPPPPEVVAEAVRHTRLRLLEGGLTSPANYLDALLRRLAAERAGRAARAGPAPPAAAELDDLGEQVLAVDPGAAWADRDRHEYGWLLSDGTVLMPRQASQWLEVHGLGRAPPTDPVAGVDVGEVA